MGLGGGVEELAISLLSSEEIHECAQQWTKEANSPKTRSSSQWEREPSHVAGAWGMWGCCGGEIVRITKKK